MNSRDHTPRILVVDDDEDVVAYIVAVLGDHGYRAEGVASGEEALQRARIGTILGRPGTACGTE